MPAISFMSVKYHQRGTSLWWIQALSMINTEQGPGNGLVCGMTQFRTKSLKLWALYDPCVISQLINPLMVYKGRIDHFSVCFKSSLTSAFIPIGDQPYFQSIVRSFAVDSPRNMSWSGFHSIKRCIHSLLSCSFCCKARLWSYNQWYMKIDFR